jgi:hypothetical protein
MNAEFWAVGSTASTPLPMSTGDVSKHLLTDGIPSMPVSVSSSFVGWPPYLLASVSFQKYNVLSVGAVAGRSERQWKGFLSWMLGVAGTRHVLALEKYRWIAPLSAFYEDAVQDVDVSNWPSSFLPGVLSARRPTKSTLRLRPDYLAIRSSGGLSKPSAIGWAVAESKGTRRSLASLRKCPANWRDQARNIELRFRGRPLTIKRHLVVATRVNPNGWRPTTRRIQIRVWNSTSQSDLVLPFEAVLDVAAAHLFGLFRNLRLHENAQAIAWAPWRRQYGVVAENSEAKPAESALLDRANSELREFRSEQARKEPLVVPLQSDSGPIEVEIAEPLMSFARSLQRATTMNEAVTVMAEAEGRLDEWERRHTDEDESRRERFLPIGVTIRFPDRA